MPGPDTPLPPPLATTLGTTVSKDKAGTHRGTLPAKSQVRGHVNLGPADSFCKWHVVIGDAGGWPQLRPNLGLPWWSRG